MTNRARVAFIGLGVMGAPMAARLLAAGHPLTVNTRTRERAAMLLDSGAVWADSASDAVAGADVVITMLPDTPDVETVGKSVIESAKPDAYWIDMSTISPTAWTRLVVDGAARGLHLIDAPVSGGEKGAIFGELSIMVGATRDDFDAVRAILSNLGRPLLIGEPGAGQVTKMCNQIITAGTIGLVAEALTVAQVNGVDPRRVREALLGGFAASKILDVHGARMLDADFEPGFQSTLHRKDVGIALDQAAQVDIDVPYTTVSARLLDGVVARGDGVRDSIVLFRHYGKVPESASSPEDVRP
ncbi:NAD(P)-dependent oxidoreductase [Nocardia sp. CWNU-33]|uniref:NAD(P)-dependent oxidoreductase n=1 Tax=Nocardia sp. CWNU-33 TaxID=3392117 RepID=UPI00398E52CD